MSDSDKVVHEYTPDENGGMFVMRIAREGKATVDGRIFDAGAITWREPPVPLMFIRQNDPSGRGGHKSSEAVAAITEIWRENDEQGFGTVYGKGYFSMDDAGQNARRLIKEGVISGVSADVGGAVVEELAEEETEDGPRLTRRIISGEIVAVTCLPIPAFDGTKVSVVSSADALIASAGEWAPPTEWFENPRLDEPTPLTVTADGRVFGHVATWGTCHVGRRDKCVTPPKSNSGYKYFNTGQVITADGKTVTVGRLTAGTGHADIEFGAQPAAAHYDNMGWAAAYVHSGEDDHGIWVAGAVSPTVKPEQVATLRAAAVSGDWRVINNELELVGVLAVNSPGFPIARTRAGLVAGAQVSLVAAGMVKKGDCGCGCNGKGDCKDKHDDAEVEETLANDEVLRIGMDDETFENSYPDKEKDGEEVEEDDKEEKDDDEEDLAAIEAELAQLDVEILLPAKL